MQENRPFERLPEEMKRMPQWVCWKRVPDPKAHSGVRKVPVNPITYGNASSTNPKTWADFPTACRAAADPRNGLAGIGFMFQDSGFFGVDVDDRPLNTPEVQEILDTLPSYAEFSQSGNGIHIICKGKLPAKGFNNHTEHIEMYDSGRFFVCTGNACTDRTQIVDCSEAVKPLYERYKTKKKEKTAKSAPQPMTRPAAAPAMLDAEQVVEKALNSRQGRRFAALMGGDISGYPSQSEAEIAFCNMLAFWTNRDAGLMDQIFRSSGLMREKWDRPTAGSTYGALTIQSAIDGTTAGYGDRRQIEPYSVNFEGGSGEPLDWNDTIQAEYPQLGATRHRDNQTTDDQTEQTSGAAPAPAPDQDAMQAATAPQPPMLPSYFYYTARDELRVDPAKLLLHIRKREKYFFVANAATDGVRRFWYDKRRGVYEWYSDEQIKAKIRSYIDRYEPTAVKTRDINEVFNLLCLDDCRKPENILNSDEALINFRNGLYNIHTGEMMPHTPSVYSTIQLDLDFTPSRSYTLADAPTFAKYLADLTSGDAEQQQLLLEYLGVCISNVHGYRYKKALFLVGAPDAGKSKYVNLISELLGERNCASVRFPELDERFQSGATYGKRLIFDADMPFVRAKTNNYFMSFTGGDGVQIEFKGMNHFTAVYKGLLLFASNQMPRWGGNTSEAAYNRMMLIKCENSIPVEKRDPDILAKMLRERAAIAALAVAALQQTIRRGYKFTQPQQFESTLAELRRGNSPAITFFEECCKIHEDADTDMKHCTKRSIMHNAFRLWCRENAPAYTVNPNQFATDIAQFLKTTDAALKRYYNGNWYYKFVLTGDAKEELHQFDTLS